MSNPADIMWAFAHGQPDPPDVGSITASRLRLAREFARDARQAVGDRLPEPAASGARLAARFARLAAGYKKENPS